MMLKGEDSVSTNQPRIRGYVSALEKNGVLFDEALLVQAGFDWRPAFSAMNSVLDRPRSEWPTAIFAVNDLCAAGAIQAIHARGLQVPEDFAIVGFDDTWLSTSIQPALTTVRMPIKEMGALAARMLADDLEGKFISQRHPVLDVSITIRQSCGSQQSAATPSFLES